MRVEPTMSAFENRCLSIYIVSFQSNLTNSKSKTKFCLAYLNFLSLISGFLTINEDVSGPSCSHLFILTHPVLGNDCILFVNDFSINKSPSSNGRKFYITTPVVGNSGPSPSSSSTNLPGGVDKKIGNRFRRVRLLVGDNKPR